MGKASRLKAERKLAAITPTRRAPLNVLFEAVEAVGDAFGTEADCAGAAALLKLTADRLGYSLTPRHVSLIAKQPSTDSIAFMGPLATAQISQADRDRAEDHRPSEGDNGHMVLISEDPPMLLDANLRQLGGYGIEAQSLAIKISSANPTSGRWQANPPDLELTYFVDDSNTSLQAWYEKALVGHREDARTLADMLRRGMTADQIATMRNPRSRMS